MTQLYKVTKIRYRRAWDDETRSYAGDYQVYRKRTDYRTHKSAVTLAFQFAEQENDIAQRRGQTDPWKYEVQVEVTDLPDFKPAVYCPKHGVQPAFNVPGLTSELTCVDCI